MPEALINEGGAITRNVVRDWMNENPITIAPSATIQDAAKVMLEHHISALPVMYDNKLVGIISQFDIARFLAQRELSPESLQTEYQKFEQATG